MNNACGKTKKVTNITGIGISLGASTVLVGNKKGVNAKEQYEPPEMVIETVDDSNRDRYRWVITK